MTTTSPPIRRLGRRARIAFGLGGAVIVLAAAVVSIIAVVGHWASCTNPSEKPHPVSYSSEVLLPFTHLDHPFGAAVDGAGNLYVTDNPPTSC